MRAKDLRRGELLGKNLKGGLPVLGSHRIMLMAMGSLYRLGEDLIKIVGLENMAIILTRFGYETGMNMAMAISELYNFDSPVEWLKAGSVLRSMTGTAHEELHNIIFDPEKKVLRFQGTWRDSIEIYTLRSEYSGPKTETACHITAGMASGYASAVFGSEVFVKEITCQAQGHDVCTFEGRCASEWGMDPQEIRAHFALDTFDKEIDRLRASLEKTKEDLARQTAEIELLKRQALQKGADGGILFRSRSMAQSLYLAERVATSNATVLIQGESGTGKEVIARYIHGRSDRGEAPFMAINCAALPPNLLESELFGHVKGAFTGADRDKTGLLVEVGSGTFFLDEVGDIPLDLQAKLLRALQEREIRPVGGVKNIPIQTRIIAATNRNLKEMVAVGLFRKDLFYRLAVFPIVLTPLRQRREDILLLARCFLTRLSPKHPGFSPEALKRMEAHSWPGNVRELENCVEYAFVLAGNNRIMPEHLPFATTQTTQDILTSLGQDLPTLKDMESRYIRMVLDHTGNMKGEAARLLGVSSNTVWRHLKGKPKRKG